MKKTFVAIILVVSLAISCKKSNDSGGTIPPPGTVLDTFMNFKAGSTWTYDYVDSTKPSPANSPYTLTSTSQDTLISGKSYHIYTNSTGNTHEYYAITGNDYYTYVGLPVSFGTKQFVNLYFKDNYGVNSSWSQQYKDTVSGTPLTVNATNTISQKGISLTVNGTVYQNVAVVTTTLTAVASTAFGDIPIVPTTDIKYYFAPDYGLIQSDVKIDLVITGFDPQHVNTHTKLKTAVLK